MKAHHTLFFILTVFGFLGITWFFFPSEGINIGKTNLRFASFAQAKKGEEKQVDVDSVLTTVSESFEMKLSQNAQDSLDFFRAFLKENPNRIYLPNDDFQYFDTIFAQFDNAKSDKQILRIMHYGDSQIEMDRITSILRQKLQEIFGGSGPGIMPVIQTVQSISISQDASGDLTRYTLYGDSTTIRAPHQRYGVMTQFCENDGESIITFRRTGHSKAYDKVKKMSRVSLLIGKNSEDFTATLKCDTINAEKKVCKANDNTTLLTWQLPANVKKGVISLSGSAEIYAVLIDGENGLAVDNIPLRGCSGTIFSRIDKKTMKASFELLNTRLVILQFGGNRMPSIRSKENISPYMKELENQIRYFKQVAPKAKILFIGPADMGKSYNGEMGTWKNLPELNDSIKAMALRNEVAYWDMFRVMGGEGSMAQWVKHNPALAGPDYIHFTQLGAQEIGTALAKSLMTYYDFYQLRQRMPNEEVLEYIEKDSDSVQQQKTLPSAL